MTDEASKRFKEIVRLWLVREGKSAARVESVTADGSSWAGDTEGGFYDRFDTEVVWIDSDGKRHMDDLDGDEMPSLWNFVIKEA